MYTFFETFFGAVIFLPAIALMLGVVWILRLVVNHHGD